jgi:hypothetical protein
MSHVKHPTFGVYCHTRPLGNPPWHTYLFCDTTYPNRYSTFGVPLQVWPDPDSVVATLGEDNLISKEWYLDTRRHIIWVPGLEAYMYYHVTYTKETWEQRARRLLNKDCDDE